MAGARGVRVRSGVLPRRSGGLGFDSELVALAVHPVLLLELRDLRRLPRLVRLLARLGGVVVQHDEVSIRHVESAEVVHRLLGVVDVLVHHVGGALRVLLVPESDLADGAVLAEDVVHLVGGDVEGKITHVEHAVHLGG